MTKGIAYWLRWLAVLPGAALAGFLILVPLRIILYQTLSNFVEPYPETPERILTPFAVMLGFIWSGAKIAPAYKYEAAVALFGIAMACLGGFVFLALFGEKWMGGRLSLPWYGAGPMLAVGGGGLALYLVRKEQSPLRQSAAKALSIFALLPILAVTAFAQDSTFKPGQSVYVVALKTTGQPDLSTENKLKEEFQKQKAFTIATSLQSADFVFLMMAEYEYNQAYVSGVGMGSEDMKSAAAFAVTPDAYTQHKADLSTLRDKSLWQISQNNGAFRGGGLPKKIVRTFHDSLKKKK